MPTYVKQNIFFALLKLSEQLKNILVGFLMSKFVRQRCESMFDSISLGLIQRFIDVNLVARIRNRLHFNSAWKMLNEKLTAAGIVASKLHDLNSFNGFVSWLWQTKTLSVEYLCNSFELITFNEPFSLFLMLLGQILSAGSARIFENCSAASTLRRTAGSNFLWTRNRKINWLKEIQLKNAWRTKQLS